MSDADKATQVQKVVIPIEGMHCNSCVKLIESEIGPLEGVENIKVDLVENNAVVEFDPARISLDTIKSEINSLGYTTGNHKKRDAKKNSFLQGLMYGFLPHIGCIGFIAASVLGATAAMNFFKPLLMNQYFFYILVALSLVFATVSSFIYLRKNSILSVPGIRRKWRYLSVMYSSTVGINLLFFMVVFPLLANVSSSAVGAFEVASEGDMSSVRLQVDIPCPGHAPLISEELKSVIGVVGIQFSYPNYFDVVYDSTRTTTEEMLSLHVFNVYRATVVDESLNQSNQSDNQSTSGCCGSSGRQPCGGCGCGGSK